MRAVVRLVSEPEVSAAPRLTPARPRSYVSGSFQGPFLAGYTPVTDSAVTSFGLQRLDHAVRQPGGKQGLGNLGGPEGVWRIGYKELECDVKGGCCLDARARLLLGIVKLPSRLAVHSGVGCG